jgi:hypothetical protein
MLSYFLNKNEEEEPEKIRMEIRDQRQEIHGEFTAYPTKYPDGIEFGENNMRRKCWRINGTIIIGETRRNFSEQTIELMTEEQRNTFLPSRVVANESNRQEQGEFTSYRSRYPEGIEYGMYKLDGMKCNCWRINGTIVKGERIKNFSNQIKRLMTDTQKDWYSSYNTRH